ncbi:type VII secretion protein EccE [Mycolicibacillus trivialis]|nr:type VII secretion protein EccE [Mycolicibacillus trivialis]
MNRPTMVWPGPARLTLVLLAIIPAAMAYPWQTVRDRWILGIAVAITLLLLVWWRGLHLTTMAGRSLGMLRGNRVKRSVSRSADRVTVVIGVQSTDPAADTLPLPLIAGYLDRYGIRAHSIQITSHDTAASTARDTWIGLTVAASDNLRALEARSASIPLVETTRVTARRLVDHLREVGWDAAIVEVDEVPALVGPEDRERWRAVDSGDGYLAAYRVTVDSDLADTLRAVWSHSAQETWTTVQITGSANDPSIAAACAFRTAERPQGAAPLPGLTPQRGIHRAVLTAISPLTADRLDGNSAVSPEALERLRWPSARRPGSPKKSRHAAA